MARTAGVSKEQSNEKILNAAIYCLANLGDKATTFQSIAAKAGVSPGLVVIFFGSRDKIYIRALDYVITTARVETQKQVSHAITPAEKLGAYYRVSIDFFRSRPDHAKIYLLLYNFASFDPKFTDICTEIKEVALKRIEGILSEGKLSGAFPGIENIPLLARFIHNSLNGLLISLLTNHQKNPDAVLLQQFEASMKKLLS